MILLCYLFPPLAVLLMGRPFSAFFNFCLTMFLFWVPGIKHALIVYADWKTQKRHDAMVEAVSYPGWFRAMVESGTAQAQQQQALPKERFDRGANGTVFRKR